MMMKKPVHMQLTEIFSIPQTFWKGKIPSLQDNTPFLCESTLFIRETQFLICLPIFFREGSSGLWREPWFFRL